MNYHQQLRTLIAELDIDQEDFPFQVACIDVFHDRIRFHWDAIEDGVEIDVAVLASAAARLGMRAEIGQSDGLNVSLFPIETEVGEA